MLSAPCLISDGKTQQWPWADLMHAGSAAACKNPPEDRERAENSQAVGKTGRSVTVRPNLNNGSGKHSLPVAIHLLLYRFRCRREGEVSMMEPSSGC